MPGVCSKACQRSSSGSSKQIVSIRKSSGRFWPCRLDGWMWIAALGTALLAESTGTGRDAKGAASSTASPGNPFTPIRRKGLPPCSASACAMSGMNVPSESQQLSNGSPTPSLLGSNPRTGRPIGLVCVMISTGGAEKTPDAAPIRHDRRCPRSRGFGRFLHQSPTIRRARHTVGILE